MNFIKYNKETAHELADCSLLLIIKEVVSDYPKYVTAVLRVSYPNSTMKCGVDMNTGASRMETVKGEPQLDWTIDEFDSVDGGALFTDDLYTPTDVDDIEILAYATLQDTDVVLNEIQ